MDKLEQFAKRVSDDSGGHGYEAVPWEIILEYILAIVDRCIDARVTRFHRGCNSRSNWRAKWWQRRLISVIDQECPDAHERLVVTLADEFRAVSGKDLDEALKG